MSEDNLWRSVRGPFALFGTVHRIENLTENGTPDVAFAIRNPATSNARSGFLELKHVHAPPVGRFTPFRIKKLKKEQVLWLEEWTGAGGTAFVLLRVGGLNGPHLFLDAPLVRAIYEGAANWDRVRGQCGLMTEGVEVGRWIRWLTEG